MRPMFLDVLCALLDHGVDDVVKGDNPEHMAGVDHRYREGRIW